MARGKREDNMTLKKMEWRKDGMKQIVNTGHKTFDDYVVCISTANCVGGGVTGLYIRPYTETECNGHSFDPGHLNNVDLDNFMGIGRHRYILREIKGLTHDRTLCLYEIYHGYDDHQGRRQVVIHGYILTTPGWNNNQRVPRELVNYWVTGPTYKSELVIQGCLPYLVDDYKETA
jgi:hypothetical protein